MRDTRELAIRDRYDLGPRVVMTTNHSTTQIESTDQKRPNATPHRLIASRRQSAAESSCSLTSQE
ncbi:hypothetical protein RRSWK_06295 [Rhodopirellula sp. SWK7]|nr:hypothetical protein RRSWK_06295 [Rhodopirellula sp. SWK7]